VKAKNPHHANEDEIGLSAILMALAALLLALAGYLLN
jgi:hypothetical protein